MNQLIGAVFYLITFIFLAGDSFDNYSSSLKYFNIDSRFLYNSFMVVQIIYRLLEVTFLPKILLKINNYFLLPLSGIVFLALAFINGFTYDFFVFNTLGINIENFKYLFFISGFVFMANIQSDWLKTIWQKLLYFAPILFLLVFNLLNIYQPESFKFLIQEDGFLESFQFILYFSASVTSFLTAIFMMGKKKRMYSLLFFLLAVGLFFIAGEEISWGQRIFQIQTPEALMRINVQKETTIHNISFFQSKLDYVYMLIGLWGCLAWVIVKKFLPKLFKQYYLIFPTPLLFFYFFAILRFYFLNKFVTFYYQLFTFERTGIGQWQEVSETILAFGFTAFAVLSYVGARKMFKKIK